MPRWPAEEAREASVRAAEARSLARDAELHALRMQINPHFLFNSLHSIAALTTVDSARAREMCIKLSDFLRSSLGLGQREIIPLSEELALARSYLEVEQVRFGARLQFTEDIQESCQDCAVPVLLLQPLVENAVKHGIAGLVEGGAVRLSVERLGGSVHVAVENGFDADAPTGQPARHGTAPRAAPAGGALWRRSEHGGRRAGWRLPRGVAIPLRIAHRFQQPRVTRPADRQPRAVVQESRCGSPCRTARCGPHAPG